MTMGGFDAVVADSSEEWRNQFFSSKPRENSNVIAAGAGYGVQPNPMRFQATSTFISFSVARTEQVKMH